MPRYNDKKNVVKYHKCKIHTAEKNQIKQDNAETRYPHHELLFTAHNKIFMSSKQQNAGRVQKYIMVVKLDIVNNLFKKYFETMHKEYCVITSTNLQSLYSSERSTMASDTCLDGSDQLAQKCTTMSLQKKYV